MNTGRPAFSQGTGRLPDEGSGTPRKSPGPMQGAGGGKGDGAGGMADGMKRSSGSIDNGRPPHHANAQGMSAKKRGVPMPFGRKDTKG